MKWVTKKRKDEKPIDVWVQYSRIIVDNNLGKWKNHDNTRQENGTSNWCTADVDYAKKNITKAKQDVWPNTWWVSTMFAKKQTSSKTWIGRLRRDRTTALISIVMCGWRYRLDVLRHGRRVGGRENKGVRWQQRSKIPHASRYRVAFHYMAK